VALPRAARRIAVSADRWHGMRLPPVGVLILGTAPRRPSSVSGAVITRATSGPGKLSRWSSAGTKSSAACAGRWDLLTVGVSVFHPDRGRFRMGVSIRHPQRSPPCGQRAVWWPAEYYIRGIGPKCPDRNAKKSPWCRTVENQTRWCCSRTRRVSAINHAAALNNLPLIGV